jgi:hypothetical protein
VHAADDPSDDVETECGQEVISDGDDNHVRYLDSVDRIEYDSATGSHSARYDVGVDTPSLVVVAAAAASLGTTALDLPPLAETLDPESLDHVLGLEQEVAAISFDFAERRVTVDRETVTVRTTEAADLS